MERPRRVPKKSEIHLLVDAQCAIFDFSLRVNGTERTDRDDALTHGQWAMFKAHEFDKRLEQMARLQRDS